MLVLLFGARGSEFVGFARLVWILAVWCRVRLASGFEALPGGLQRCILHLHLHLHSH